MQNVTDSSEHTWPMSRLGLLEHGSRDHNVLHLYKWWIIIQQFIWLNNLKFAVLYQTQFFHVQRSPFRPLDSAARGSRAIRPPLPLSGLGPCVVMFSWYSTVHTLDKTRYQRTWLHFFQLRCHKGKGGVCAVVSLSRHHNKNSCKNERARAPDVLIAVRVRVLSTWWEAHTMSVSRAFGPSPVQIIQNNWINILLRCGMEQFLFADNTKPRIINILLWEEMEDWI